MTNPSKHSPLMSKFISINYCVPLDDILGWEPVKGKMVPKALWAITKRVGKGCRAQSDKKKYGFTLMAWQETTLLQLEKMIRDSEANILVKQNQTRTILSPPAFNHPITQNQLRNHNDKRLKHQTSSCTNPYLGQHPSKNSN